jgi:O-antigen/teichoic acid export membrane protein
MSRVQDARKLFASPLVRNAYSLVGSTLATSLLGVAFWIVAARKFPAASVGINSALVSSMAFLSNVAGLNLANGFNRFVPTAGRRTRRLVLVGYALTVALTAIAATVFVVGTSLWAPRLSFITTHHSEAAWFVVACMIWTIFVLQDAVLTGLGEAHFVLIENTVYGLLKLALLVALAASAARFGIFAAWTLPLIVLVLPVNVLIFGRLVPQRSGEPIEEIDASTIARNIGVDFLSVLMMTAMLGIIPLLVLAVDGARANAYVALAWTIAYPLHLISMNVGMAMITEASRAPEHLREYARRTIAHALRIVAPLAAVTIVLAPYALRIFGPDYARQATRPLQLFALAAIPNVFVVAYMSIARVQRRMWLVVAATAVQAGTTITLTVVLLHLIGIAGVGWAMLAGLTGIAVFLLLHELRSVWLPYVSPAVLTNVRRPSTYRMHRTAARAARDVLDGAGLADAGWRTDGGIDATEQSFTSAVHNSRTDARAMFRVAFGSASAEEIEDEIIAINTLIQAVPEYWRDKMPGILGSNVDTFPVWLLEDRRNGEDGRTALADPHKIVSILRDASTQLSELYEFQRRTVPINERQCGRFIDAPIAAMRALGPTKGLLGAEDDLHAMQEELHDALAGREITMSLAHGDLWLGSIWWHPADERLACVVDWRRASIGPPVLDVAHLWCTTRALAERRELGDIVREMLAGGEWSPGARLVVATAPGWDEMSFRTVVLLAWLRHIYNKTTRGRPFRASELWLAHNVQRVVENL